MKETLKIMQVVISVDYENSKVDKALDVLRCSQAPANSRITRKSIIV